MTRINVIPVTQLCDQHLLAEHRELTRIPNMIVSGKLKTSYPDAPTDYVLGTGHVKFFVDKLWWLRFRHMELTDECKYRGFAVSNRFPEIDTATTKFIPTEAAIALNRARINERLQAMAASKNRPRWTLRDAPDWIPISV